MNQLLIATTNPGKLADFKQFLSDLPLELVSLKDLNIDQSVEETGRTFEENAILKAKFYYQITGLITLADDGGFEIDALNGEPGVKSHRWVDPNRETEDEELIAFTIEQMKSIPMEKRNAQLRLVLALASPDGKIETVEELARGIVPLNAGTHRTKGYPFRSLLFIPEINKFYDHSQMTQDEINKYDHRKRAVEKLKPIIQKWLTDDTIGL
ncbi:MAG: non-canonical purine NTP pyrophosphatase [Patescibacteria group bacterium]